MTFCVCSPARLAGLVLCSALALPGQVPVLPLEPVVVRSTRLETRPLNVPGAVSVLDTRHIQSASPPLSLDGALQTVPGVFVLNPYNFAQDSRISIRGAGARATFGIRGVRVIVDGIPATLPDGQSGVDGIDLGSAGRLEVLRGPSASLYGPSSGGVILIETESAAEGKRSEAEYTGGAFGLRQSALKGGVAMGPWNLRVGTSYLNLEGYRAHSQTDNRQLNMTLRQDAGGGRVVTAVLQVIDYPMQQDPGGLTAQEVEADPRQARDRNVAYDAGEEVWQEKAGISVQLPVAMNQVLELQGYSVHRDFANRLPFMDGGQVDLERMFFGGGIRYRYSSPLFRAVAGVEGGKQVDDRRNFDNVLGDRGALVLDQEEKVSNLGAYVAGEIGLSREVTLHPALRLDTVRFVVEDFLEEDGDGSGDRTFQAVSPALGICWQPSAPVAFYGNLTTSFETPTTTELNRPEGGGFDPDLEAETAQGVEWGFKGDLADYPGRPVVDLAVFHIEVDDALVPYVPEGSSGREFYRNAGSARKRGLEVSVRFWPQEALAVDLSYTFSDFKYRSFETPDGDFGGNRLPGIPEHFGNLRLDYPTKGGHRLIWNTRVVGAMEAEDSNATRVDAYHFSDLRAEWEREVGRWDLGIVGGIHNVFNARYAANIRINAPGGRFYEPAPERNLYLGFRVRVEL